MEVSYFTNYANWRPSYDLRFVDLNNPISLFLKGEIIQTTGENWENVKLILSTSNPTISQQKPKLYPWYLSVYMPKATSDIEIRGQRENIAVAYAEEEIKTYNKPAPVMMAIGYETPISMEYTLEAKIDVPSNQEKIVNIQSYDLPAKYLYYTAPKIDPDAF